MRSWRPAEPDIRKVRGGWLACTPPDHPYRIATVGHTEGEAKRRFASAMAAWEDLHQFTQQEQEREREQAAGRR